MRAKNGVIYSIFVYETIKPYLIEHEFCFHNETDLYMPFPNKGFIRDELTRILNEKKILNTDLSIKNFSKVKNVIKFDYVYDHKQYPFFRVECFIETLDFDDRGK